MGLVNQAKLEKRKYIEGMKVSRGGSQPRCCIKEKQLRSSAFGVHISVENLLTRTSVELPDYFDVSIPQRCSGRLQGTRQAA